MTCTSQSRFIRFATIGIVALFLSQSCALVGASTLSADPIDSQVVDANTGKPIEGAVVVAYWELHPGSLGGDALPCGAANVEEAVTGQDGRFHIPGWGPTKRACSGGMREGNPLIFIFKSGYGYGRYSNGPGMVDLVNVTHNAWANLQMKLKKFSNMDLAKHDAYSYEGNFQLLNSYLEFFTVNMPGQCNWKKIPNMLKAIIAERKLFNVVGNYNIDSIDIQLSRDMQDKFMQKLAPECGSPKMFIRGLEK